MIQLILGGARSGKSRFAEQAAKDSNLNVTYIATAQAFDREMQARIDHHQAQRPQHWTVIEESLYLAECLMRVDEPNQLILVDCLTLWMSNLLMHENAELQSQECLKLLEVLASLQSELIVVSNETGLGVIPLGEISRKFVDESGRLHQQLGQIAEKVVFCIAGFPMMLKGEK